jgi:hypothetical protein
MRPVEQVQSRFVLPVELTITVEVQNISFALQIA